MLGSQRIKHKSKRMESSQLGSLQSHLSGHVCAHASLHPHTWMCLERGAQHVQRRVDGTVGLSGGGARWPRERERQWRRWCCKAWGVAVAERRAPSYSVCGEAWPALRIDVEVEQRLVDTPTVGHWRRTTWPRLRHPRSPPNSVNI